MTTRKKAIQNLSDRYQNALIAIRPFRQDKTHSGRAKVLALEEKAMADYDKEWSRIPLS